ncbi:MAG: thermonuclease family protein [Hyphomonadaceae bacterium]
MDRRARCGGRDLYQDASAALSSFIGRRRLACTPRGEDQYHRTMATCSVNGADLGEHMVWEGWARDWARYSDGAYADEEAAARSAARGVWACPIHTWADDQPR